MMSMSDNSMPERNATQPEATTRASGFWQVQRKAGEADLAAAVAMIVVQGWTPPPARKVLPTRVA